MYIVYICEYNQWSIVSGIERAPVALSWSVHVQFTATRKHCSKKYARVWYTGDSLMTD